MNRSSLRLPFLVFLTLLVLCTPILATGTNSLSPVRAAAWEQTITPLGSGFESSYVGGWIHITSQNTVSCSTDTTNAIYTRTRTPPSTDDVDWARWRPTIPSTGKYQVYVYIPQYTHSMDVTGQAQYKIQHANGQTTQVIDQNQNLCNWVSLGEYTFNQGTDGYVYMGDYTGDDPKRLIAADGVKFVQVDTAPEYPLEVYTDTNYGGNRCYSTEAKTANIHSSCNDLISSLKLQSGWSVRLYEGTNQQGTSACFTATDGDLNDNTFEDSSAVNDRVSSFVLYQQASCDSPTTTPELTRSHLYVDSRNYLVLEFCGKNIHQDVYIGSKRSGRDFGVQAKRVDFGSTEQCATDDNLADGRVLPSTTYNAGVSLTQQDLYNVCGSSKGLCDSVTTQVALPVTPPPPPSGSCTVPFFWQSDPVWKNNRLGSCTGNCASIGNCGCALTSLAMVFKYYGATVTPATLGACLGKIACPLAWSSSTRCSADKVKWGSWPSFSWSKLEAEVKKGPVILQANRSGGMHFVVVTSGSGSNAQNYTINDPAMKGGAGVKLNSLYGRGYNFNNTSMRLFIGTPACQSMASEFILSSSESLDELHSGAFPEVNSLTLSAIPITGTVVLYQTTETTMTVELSAQSNSGDITDMLIWTDTISNTNWQTYTAHTELLISNEVYVRFRDENENISEPAMTPLDPIGSPPESPYVSLESVSISGRTTTSVETEITLTATSGPETATPDVTYTWQATGWDTITQTNGLSDTMTFSWDTPGVKIVNVLASNGEGNVSASHEVIVESATETVYLPVIIR